MVELTKSFKRTVDVCRLCRTSGSGGSGSKQCDKCSFYSSVRSVSPSDDFTRAEVNQVGIDGQHNPDNCPNAARTDVLIHQLDLIYQRMDSVLLEKDFTAAINVIRTNQSSIVKDITSLRKDVEQVIDDVECINSTIKASRQVVHILQWFGGLAMAGVTIWAIFSGKGV